MSFEPLSAFATLDLAPTVTDSVPAAIKLAADLTDAKATSEASARTLKAIANVVADLPVVSGDEEYEDAIEEIQAILGRAGIRT